VDLPLYIQAGIAIFSVITLVISFFRLRHNRRLLREESREIERRIYESSILREIGEQIGYELNISKIIDTIIESLDRILPFSVVSYMLISPDGKEVIEKIHLEESVSREFLDKIKVHTLETLNEISPRIFQQGDLRETLSGVSINEQNRDEIGSMWVTPLTINTRGIGALAIASKKQNLYTGPEMDILTKLLSQANRAVNNLEAVIYSEQRRIDAMVLSMTDGVLMFDHEFNLLIINPTAQRLLGINTPDTPTIFDVSKALADKVDLRAKVEECYQNDQPIILDDLYLGEKVSQVMISTVKDKDKKVIGSVVLFHDITAQKQLDQIRDAYTAMMVHELRAPLTVVRGTADVILKNPVLSTQEEGQKLLKTMQSSADTMLGLVNDLLDVAKIESGKFQIKKAQGNAGEVISDRVNFFQPIVQPKSISLVSELPSEPISCWFDRERLLQVLNNLISNAIKFTPVGGKITVSCQMLQSNNDIKWRFGPVPVPSFGPSVIFTISDSGAGIPADKIGLLFSRFQQIEPGRMGSGLGLVITKGIVESHGGTIFLESKQDEGTSVHFTIPVS
jgi:signal transduction histidine kinase